MTLPPPFSTLCVHLGRGKKRQVAQHQHMQTEGGGRSPPALISSSSFWRNKFILLVYDFNSSQRYQDSASAKNLQLYVYVVSQSERFLALTGTLKKKWLVCKVRSIAQNHKNLNFSENNLLSKISTWVTHFKKDCWARFPCIRTGGRSSKQMFDNHLKKNRFFIL